MAVQKFVNKAVRLFKDINESSGVEERIESDVISIEEVEELNFLTDEADVILAFHDDTKTAAVELVTYEDGPTLDTRYDSNKLYIEAIKPDTTVFLLGFIHHKKPKLIITLPKQIYKRLIVETRSGSIFLEEIESEAIHCLTGSGKIELNQLKAKSIVLETSSGAISLNNISSRLLKFTSSSGGCKLNHINAEIIGEARSGQIIMMGIHSEVIEVETSSGRINIEGAKGSSVQVTSSSGSINVENLRGKHIGFSSSSGSVKFSRIVTSHLSGSTSSGSIRIGLDTPDADIDLKTASGSLAMAYLNEKPDANIFAKTSSGSMSIDLPLNGPQERDRHSWQGTTGSGKNQVKLKTASGSIRVSWNTKS